MTFNEFLTRIVYLGAVGVPGIIAVQLWKSGENRWTIAMTAALFVVCFVILMRNVRWSLDHVEINNNSAGKRDGLFTSLVITSITSSYFPVFFVFIALYDEVRDFMILIMLGALFLFTLPRVIIRWV